MTVIGGFTALPTFAQSISENALTGSNFQSFSIVGGAALGFSSIGTTPAGATLAGGAAQGANIAAITGETFIWTGAASTLSAIAVIDTGAGGGDTYQPFLFNLGTGVYNTPSSQFNLSAQTDLLGASDSVTLPGVSSGKTQLEIDFSGADQITLQTGDTYAFGLLYTGGSTANLNFERSSGAQSDPNGDGFTATGLSATADNAAPYSGSVRNEFIGVYATTPVPEPSTYAMLGGGLTLLGGLRRFKK